MLPRIRMYSTVSPDTKLFSRALCSVPSVLRADTLPETVVCPFTVLLATEVEDELLLVFLLSLCRR